VINQVLIRLWENRAELEFNCLAAWWAYVAKAARRLAIKGLGQAKNAVELEEDIAPAD